jgi:hypothetical protein
MIVLSAWGSLWLRNKFLLQYQEYISLRLLDVLPIGTTTKQKLIM